MRAKERSKNLRVTNPIQPHVDHEAYFAFCRGTLLTPSAHSGTASLGAGSAKRRRSSASLPFSKDELRRSVVWPSQRSVFCIVGVGYTYPLNSWSFHNTTEMFSYRTRQPSLQGQAGDPISEVQNFSGLEEEVSCPHLHN